VTEYRRDSRRRDKLGNGSCGTTGGKLELSKCLYYLHTDDGSTMEKEQPTWKRTCKSHIRPLPSQNPNRPSGQLSSASNTGIWPTPEAHSTSNTKSLARANLRGRMHQSANDSLRSVHRYWTMWLQPSFRLSTTMNRNNSTKTNDPAQSCEKVLVQNDTRRNTSEIGLRHLGPEQRCNRPFSS
jgi:hypothetical protein